MTDQNTPIRSAARKARVGAAGAATVITPGCNLPELVERDAGWIADAEPVHGVAHLRHFTGKVEAQHRAPRLSDPHGEAHGQPEPAHRVTETACD